LNPLGLVLPEPPRGHYQFCEDAGFKQIPRASLSSKIRDGPAELG
jgi:hypothetical protein